MDPLTVMVTGVGGGGFGEQILKALRLARSPYRIVGTDMSPLSKGLTTVDQPLLLPPASDPGYMDCVLAACRKFGVRALFPGSEPELKVISRERLRVQQVGVFLPINPPEVIEIGLDKLRTAEALGALGFSVPRTIRIRSLSDLDQVTFNPVVLKPSVGGGGSANTLLAQSREELTAFAGHLLQVYPEFVVQEYVGRPEEEYTVGVLLSMEGELIHSIAVRRLILNALSNRMKVPNRSGHPDLGPILALSSGISQGEVGRFVHVTEPCERMAVALGCRGAVNIQCRWAGGRVVVFEINPRFSGTTSIRAMAGYNEPDLLIRRHLLGETIEPRFAYRSGFVLRGLEETFMEGPPPPRAQEYL
jgi:carbamoyl-phosphate synthase large subunit